MFKIDEQGIETGVPRKDDDLIVAGDFDTERLAELARGITLLKIVLEGSHDRSETNAGMTEGIL